MEFTWGEGCSGRTPHAPNVKYFYRLSQSGGKFFFFFCLLSSMLILFFGINNLIWKIVYFRKCSTIFHIKILQKSSIKKRNQQLGLEHSRKALSPIYESTFEEAFASA